MSMVNSLKIAFTGTGGMSWYEQHEIWCTCVCMWCVCPPPLLPSCHGKVSPGSPHPLLFHPHLSIDIGPPFNEGLHHVQHAPLASHVQRGLGGQVFRQGHGTCIDIRPRPDEEKGRGGVPQKDGSVDQRVRGAIRGLVYCIWVTSMVDLLERTEIGVHSTYRVTTVHITLHCTSCHTCHGVTLIRKKQRIYK